MREVRLENVRGFRPVALYDSSGVAAATLPAGVQVTVVTVAAGGRIGRHPAPVDQCLVVLAGRADVSTAVTTMHVGAGRAVLWAAGEQHETNAVDDLVALVIEGDGLADALP